MSAQVRPGYKLTEIGVIPNEWSIKRLGDLAIVGAGGTPSREKAAYWNGLIPWVTTSQIDFNTITYADQFITVAGLQNSAAKLLPAGTLLMALYGQGKTRGKVGVLGIEAATNQACASILLTDGISREFALHFLASRYESIRNSSNTGGQENLNGQIVKDTPVVLPPISEQRAIAAALSDMDALITGLDQLIAKKRDLKQAAMQQLLTGQQRLPGFSGEWIVKTIGESIDLLSGFPFPSDLYSDSGVRLLRGSNVKRGQTDWSDEITQFWPSIHHEIAKYEVKVGDLVISMDGSLVGRSYARIVEADLPALLLQRVARIRSRSIDIGYLAQFIGSPFFTAHCDSVKTVTAIPHISADDIRSFSIPTPPTFEEQTAIATILSDLDSELSTYEIRRDKARQLKLGMMQELLTGRIRLL
ncbi:restriction endonuclease subunit S [Pseudomonas marginalis]|uniref:restriction endonuclease subunit S n=1 Tax=Pseudomonas marginalis TaxID=298 RepID=UPI0011B38693|nr:restriction endonuclease subunit S [Pseudomonas marginalis]KAA8556364.1 Type-1 restriction enzyme EcoKI specificity protein [Pseudomonas marginalis]TWR66932.1 restriction endonuclease subunit S [Pseudomonas marginalis]